MFKRLFKNRKGAAMVEYALLIGGIALISSGAVSLFGHKTSDIIGTMAAIIPGAHVDDNAPIVSGKLIETAPNAAGAIGLDTATILANSDGTHDRLQLNTTGDDTPGFGGLVVEAH